MQLIAKIDIKRKFLGPFLKNCILECCSFIYSHPYIFVYKTSLMEDLPFEIRALAHHILQSHGVYRLEMAQLQEMITLLNQEHSNDPKEIQQSLFQGIVKFHQLYGYLCHNFRDRVSQGLSDPSFESVSSQTKSLMHKILHEYNFLDKIKAWEIFLPPF